MSQPPLDCPILDANGKIPDKLIQGKWIHWDMRISAGNVLVFIGMLITVGVAWGRMEQRTAIGGSSDQAAIIQRLTAIEKQETEMREDVRLILKYILDQRRQSKVN